MALTVYELGGTPQNPRNTEARRMGRADPSPAAQTVTLNKGDMLVIPRGMPHKRTTATSVTLILISDTAPSYPRSSCFFVCAVCKNLYILSVSTVLFLRRSRRPPKPLRSPRLLKPSQPA